MHPAEKLAHELDNIEHAKSKSHTHVVQVWQDGEITFQKCGDLLWQRTLHQIVPPLRHYVAGLKLPREHCGNSYAFVGSQEEAQRIRDLLEVKVTP